MREGDSQGGKEDKVSSIAKCEERKESRWVGGGQYIRVKSMGKRSGAYHSETMEVESNPWLGRMHLLAR